MELLDLVRITQSGDRCLVGPFRAHSSFFAEARRKDENKRSQTIAVTGRDGSPSRPSTPERPPAHDGLVAPYQKMASPTTSPARPDARVQHVDLQFGKGSGMHLQFASTARECLVMKQNNIFSVFSQSQRRARNVRLVHCSSKKRRTCVELCLLVISSQER